MGKRDTARLGIRGLLGLVAATAVLVGAGTTIGWTPSAGAAAGAPTGPPATDGPTAAAVGASWLATQLDTSLPLNVFGSPDWGTTLEAALALAQTGVGTDRAAAVLAAVAANRESVVAPGGTDNPGRLSRTILLAHLLGGDPRAVGTAPGADLVARLEATRRTAGADAGLYGEGDPTYDGAFRQGLALAALDAVGVAPDPSAPAWLVAQQCADGSWMPYRADLAVACAFDGTLFVGPDSNSTALALVGLHVTGTAAPVPAGVGWLVDHQNDDGGWGFYPGDPSDPNSTALGRQALVTLGATGTAGSADPLPALLAFQLGCASATGERGAFTGPFSNGAPDLLSTVQAVPGALGAPIPGTAGAVVEALPAVDCTATTTSTTTTSTTSTSTTTAPTTTSTTAAPQPAPPVVAGATQTATGAGTSATSSTSSGGGTAATGGARLAATGAPADRLVPLALGLVLAGSALLVVRRRAATR